MALYDEIKMPEILQCPACETTIEREQVEKAKAWGEMCPFCRGAKLEDFDVLDPMKGVEDSETEDRGEGEDGEG